MSILKPSNSYRPFAHPWAVDIAQQHEKIHWVESEAELSDDVHDWAMRLTDDEKEFITHVLRLFTQLDVEVGANYYNVLIPAIKNNEVRNMLGSFAAREAIHQRAYALLLDTLGLPDDEFTKFTEYKEMADKIEFMRGSNSSSITHLARAMAQSVANEGVSLFASFAMLLNFQRYGKMQGMGTIVEWSIRDESMHVMGLTKLFKELCNEHPRIVTDELKTDILNVFRTAVALEDKFVALAFRRNNVHGLDKDDIMGYIRYLADKRLLQLGLKANWHRTENPLPWLDWVVNGASHDNFFEKRVTEYSVSNLRGDWWT